MKDKILLSGEKYGIQLASAAIYYQIVLMIKTRETLAAAYTFLACSFSRIGDIRSELIAENDSPSKAKVMNYTKKVGFLDQLKSHILDYAVMLTDPELAPGFYESLKAYSSIPSSERGSNIPVELILRTYQEESVETFDRTVKLATFFLALGERYKQNGIYERMVAPMLKHLSSSVRSPGRSPIGERGPLDALSIIWSDSIAKLLPRLTYWLPRKNMQLPSEIQKDTFLGPFLSSYNIYPEFGLDLSPVFFPEDYGDSGTGSSSIDMHTEYIGNRKSYDVELSMKYIFNSTESALKALHSCVIGVTRSGDIGKEAVLQYISRAIAFNSSRTKIHTNVEKHCSDGFMHNLSAVCLLLCDPFISGAPHKVHLVDPYYLLLSEKIDGSDYTGIFADNKKRQEYAEKIIEERGLSSYNFVTEIFFLTMVCSHVGMLTIYHNYTSLIKQIESLKERVKRMRDDRDKKKWADSVTFVANNFILKFNERQLEYLTSNRLCVEAMLRNPMVTNLMLKFYNFVLLYIIRCTLVPKKVIEDGFTLRINDNINWEWFFSGDLQGYIHCF